MAKIFMSYSHRDEPLRDELETHLSMLKREGLISTWHDRKILAGDEFESDIDENLEDSDVILLLISPYFLDSDYCFDVEMKRALEMHEKGKARMIPVILEHSDWKSAPFGKLKALPKDGRPITDYPNQHKAFLEIAQGIRKAIEETNSKSSKPTPAQTATKTNRTSSAERKDPERSSNLRIKKNFSDKEKDDFLVNSFEYVFKFFKNSLEELKDRNNFIDFNLERVDSQTFTVRLYKEEKQVGQCKIWRGSDSGNRQTIKYSNSIGDGNSFNMLFSVNDDGYTQYLESSLMNPYSFFDYDGEEEVSEKGASEQIWTALIGPLQR